MTIPHVDQSVQFSVKELKRVWAVLRTVIPTRSILPILEMVLVERKNGRWTFTATDLETSVKVHVDSVAEDAEDQMFLMNFRRTSGLLNATHDGTMTVEPFVGTKGHAYRILIGRGTYTFLSHDPLDYPSLPDHDIPLSLGPSAVLKRKFIQECKTFVYPCVSMDALRPAMQAVYLDLNCAYWSYGTDRKVPAVVATDGHRLACNPIHDDDGSVFSVPAEAVKGGSSSGFYLPPCLFDNVGKFLSEEVSIYHKGGHTIISCGDLTFIWRNMDEVFLNYVAVIPTIEGTTVTLEAMFFINMCRRLKTTCSSMTWQSRWSFTKDRVTVGSEDIERDLSGSEWAPCEIKGDPVTIGLNLNYAEALFRPFAKSKLILNITSPNRAIRIEEDNGEDPGKLFLLMPVMLNTYM